MHNVKVKLLIKSLYQIVCFIPVMQDKQMNRINFSLHGPTRSKIKTSLHMLVFIIISTITYFEKSKGTLKLRTIFLPGLYTPYCRSLDILSRYCLSSALFTARTRSMLFSFQIFLVTPKDAFSSV